MHEFALHALAQLPSHPASMIWRREVDNGESIVQQRNFCAADAKPGFNGFPLPSCIQTNSTYQYALSDRICVLQEHLLRNIPPSYLSQKQFVRVCPTTFSQLGFSAAKTSRTSSLAPRGLGLSLKSSVQHRLAARKRARWVLYKISL